MSARSFPSRKRIHGRSPSWTTPTSGDARRAARAPSEEAGIRAHETSLRIASTSGEPLEQASGALEEVLAGDLVPDPGRSILEVGRALPETSERDEARARRLELLEEDVERLRQVLAVRPLGGDRERMRGSRLVLLQDPVHETREGTDLLLAVPDVAEDPEVRGLGPLALAEECRGRDELQDLHGAPVRERDA